MSSAIFTGISQSSFTRQDGKYTGVTSDTDGRIHARNSLRGNRRGARFAARSKPGNTFCCEYLDPPWQGFYDVFKIINEDLLIGRVYLGEYPNGARAVHLSHVAAAMRSPA